MTTHPFIDYLYDLAKRNDRAALAELRRGFLSPIAPLRYVVPFLKPDASRREESALCLVGQLFGLHPTPGGLRLAQALRLLATKSESVELRFRALLDCDAEDLDTHRDTV